MTTYLMIGGPNHGETAEISHSRRTWSPDHSTFVSEDSADHPVAPLVAYDVWEIPERFAPPSPPLAIRKVADMSDDAAVAALGQILLPRFEAIMPRLLGKHREADLADFRSFLDRCCKTSIA